MIIVFGQSSGIFRNKLRLRKCDKISLQKFQNSFKSSISKFTYSLKDPPVKFFMNKFKSFIILYEEMSGIMEVKAAQDNVIKARERLIEAQNNRRQASKHLSAIHKKLKSIYVDLDNTKRGDKKYLVLITEEQGLLEKEEEYKEKFKEAENEERQQFEAFSSAVNISHEKEKAQSQKMKYWSIIGSIIGTVIGIIGSSINNYFKMSEMKRIIQQSNNADISHQLEAKLQETKETIKEMIEFQKTVNLNNGNNIESYSLEKLFDKVNNRLMGLEKIVNNNCCSGKANLTETDPQYIYFQSSITSLERKTENIKYILISASLLLVTIPLFSKIFF